MTAQRTAPPDGFPPRPPRAPVAAGSLRRRSRPALPSVVLTLLAVAVCLASVLTGGGTAAADPSASDWQRLRQCESGNNYTANTGNGYYGAYQFDASTWRSVGGTGLPHQASPATQDALALKLWQQRGWSPWVCASILGLDGSGGGGGGGGGNPSGGPATGSLDQVRAAGLSATVAGWVVDPTTASTPSQVHVYVSAPGMDQKGYAFTADTTREDVNRALGITGRHGFSVQVPLRAGPNTVCAFAIGAAGNSLLSCQSVTGATAAPRGSVDVVSAEGLSARVAGWAYDPGTPGTSIPVHVYVNGVGYAIPTTGSRPDVNAVYGISGQHGYVTTVPLRRGTNSVCVFAIGSASAGNLLISCRDVQSAEPPLGALDGIQISGASARVSGWTFDPATSASTEVHIYVNGVGYAFRADDDRPDVNAAFRITGAHGYSETVPLTAGRNSVCAFGIGRSGNPTNLFIGCRDVQGAGARSGAAVQEAPTEAIPPPSAASTAPSPATSGAASSSAAPSNAAPSSAAQSSAAPSSAAPPAAATSVTTPVAPTAPTPTAPTGAAATTGEGTR